MSTTSTTFNYQSYTVQIFLSRSTFTSTWLTSFPAFLTDADTISQMFQKLHNQKFQVSNPVISYNSRIHGAFYSIAWSNTSKLHVIILNLASPNSISYHLYCFTTSPLYISSLDPDPQAVLWSFQLSLALPPVKAIAHPCICSLVMLHSQAYFDTHSRHSPWHYFRRIFPPRIIPFPATRKSRNLNSFCYFVLKFSCPLSSSDKD